MLLRCFRLFPTSFLFLSLPLVGSLLKAQETTAVWKGGVGNWDEPMNWSTDPFIPNNDGVQTYSAIINTGSVTLNRPITIEQLLFGMAGSPTLQDAITSGRKST